MKGRKCYYIWSRDCLPFWSTWVNFLGSYCSIFSFKCFFYFSVVLFVLRFTTSDYPLVSSNFSQVSSRVTEDIVLRVAINFHFRLLSLLVICSDDNIYRGSLTFTYCFHITVSVVHLTLCITGWYSDFLLPRCLMSYYIDVFNLRFVWRAVKSIQTSQY